MDQIRKFFDNESILNRTDYKLESLMRKFGVKTNFSLENYEFHVDVGKG